MANGITGHEKEAGKGGVRSGGRGGGGGGGGNWRLGCGAPLSSYYTNVTPSSWFPGEGQSSTSTWTPSSKVGGVSSPGRPRRMGAQSWASSLTLGEARKEELCLQEKKRRSAMMLCKSLCLVLLLATFVLVIVAVSVFLSNGRNHFG